MQSFRERLQWRFIKRRRRNNSPDPSIIIVCNGKRVIKVWDRAAKFQLTMYSVFIAEIDHAFPISSPCMLIKVSRLKKSFAETFI